MLNRDDILKLTKRRTKKLRVKSWNKEVTIRALSAGELDHVESMTQAFRDDPMAVTSRFRATVAAYGLSDASGNRLFSDDDIEALDDLPADGLTEVQFAVMKFNESSAIEELEKNSETTPSEGSGTS